MIIHSSPLFTIYFGNAQDKLNQNEYRALSPECQLLEQQSFAHLAQALSIQSLVFLKQIHKNTGSIVTQENIHQLQVPFATEGDYLLTNMPGVGIGVMTADCLPIIIHDTRTNSIAAIHAGWRGSVAHIAPVAFKHMQEAYGTRPADVRVFFGPSAQPCCYEVGKEVVDCAQKDQLLKTSLIHHKESTYLHLAQYNVAQLISLGIPRLAFHMKYNACTICDVRLCSYRRDRGPYRQMTVVALR